MLISATFREGRGLGETKLNEDDLPPPQKEHKEQSLGFALGEVAGAIAWIALVFGIVGALAYAAIQLMS